MNPELNVWNIVNALLVLNKDRREPFGAKFLNGGNDLPAWLGAIT